MNQISSKAILVVSFGTSYKEARIASIEQIEKDISKAFPDFRIYHAWTSKMILSVLRKRDSLVIPTVKEAMEQMIQDGITKLIVQPTHILDGIENNIMKEDVLSYKKEFQSIVFGAPLLSSEKDSQAIIHAISEEFPDLASEDALVLMGHGTAHHVNVVYSNLNKAFKSMGYPNFFLGTVEAEPTVQDLVTEVEEFQPDKIVLTPFMIVAGDHAHNDMAGTEPDSWLHQFRQMNKNVCPVLKGLGEYPGIRSMFIEHIQDAMTQL